MSVFVRGVRWNFRDIFFTRHINSKELIYQHSFYACFIIRKLKKLFKEVKKVYCN